MPKTDSTDPIENHYRNQVLSQASYDTTRKLRAVSTLLTVFQAVDHESLTSGERAEFLEHIEELVDEALDAHQLVAHGLQKATEAANG